VFAERAASATFDPTAPPVSPRVRAGKERVYRGHRRLRGRLAPLRALLRAARVSNTVPLAYRTAGTRRETGCELHSAERGSRVESCPSVRAAR
jgi:hypothetical protein